MEELHSEMIGDLGIICMPGCEGFVEKVERYLKTWHDKFLMDEDMVELAYEYCIMQTTKLSFPYINSILKRWHELNIHNVADAKKDHEDFKTKNRCSNY